MSRAAPAATPPPDSHRWEPPARDHARRASGAPLPSTPQGRPPVGARTTHNLPQHTPLVSAISTSTSKPVFIITTPANEPASFVLLTSARAAGW